MLIHFKIIKLAVNLPQGLYGFQMVLMGLKVHGPIIQNKVNLKRFKFQISVKSVSV